MAETKKDSSNDYRSKSLEAPQLQPQQPPTLHQQQSHATSTPTTSSTPTTTSTPTVNVQGTNRTLAPKPVNPTATQLVQPEQKLKVGSKPAETGSEKRGPGRPPGSTKKNLEQQKGQQQQSVQNSNGDLKGN